MNSAGRTISSLRGFLVGAVCLLALTGAAGFAVAAAQQNSATGPDDRHLRGDSDAGKTLSVTQLSSESLAGMSARARVSAAANWGVMGYESQTGLTCLTAGPVRNGVVGSVSPGGFTALDPAQAPGNCGDIQANLRDMGGIALIHHGRAGASAATIVGLVYGAVGAGAKNVTLRLPDGTERLVKIDPTTHLPGVAGTFAAPLPSGLVGSDVVVVITRSDGSRHELEF